MINATNAKSSVKFAMGICLRVIRKGLLVLIIVFFDLLLFRHGSCVVTVVRRYTNYNGLLLEIEQGVK